MALIDAEVDKAITDPIDVDASTARARREIAELFVPFFTGEPFDDTVWELLNEEAMNRAALGIGEPSLVLKQIDTLNNRAAGTPPGQPAGTSYTKPTAPVQRAMSDAALTAFYRFKGQAEDDGDVSPQEQADVDGLASLFTWWTDQPGGPPPAPKLGTEAREALAYAIQDARDHVDESDAASRDRLGELFDTYNYTSEELANIDARQTERRDDWYERITTIVNRQTEETLNALNGAAGAASMAQTNHPLSRTLQRFLFTGQAADMVAVSIPEQRANGVWFTRAIEVVEAQLRTGNLDDLDRKILEQFLDRFRMSQRVAAENISADFKVVATGVALDVTMLGVGRIASAGYGWVRGRFAAPAVEAGTEAAAAAGARGAGTAATAGARGSATAAEASFNPQFLQVVRAESAQAARRLFPRSTPQQWAIDAEKIFQQHLALLRSAPPSAAHQARVAAWFRNNVLGRGEQGRFALAAGRQALPPPVRPAAPTLPPPVRPAAPTLPPPQVPTIRIPESGLAGGTTLAPRGASPTVLNARLPNPNAPTVLNPGRAVGTSGTPTVRGAGARLPDPNAGTVLNPGRVPGGAAGGTARINTGAAAPIVAGGAVLGAANSADAAPNADAAARMVAGTRGIKATQRALREGRLVVESAPNVTLKLADSPAPDPAKGQTEADDEGSYADPFIITLDNEGNGTIPYPIIVDFAVTDDDVDSATIGAEVNLGNLGRDFTIGQGTSTSLLQVTLEDLMVDAMPPINVDVTPMDGRLVHMEDGANPATSLHPVLNLLTRDILEFDGNTINVLFYPEFMAPPDR